MGTRRTCTVTQAQDLTVELGGGNTTHHASVACSKHLFKMTGEFGITPPKDQWS